jgi:hypothetical protein
MNEFDNYKYDARLHSFKVEVLGARVSKNPDGSLVVWPVYPRGAVAQFQGDPFICYTKADVEKIEAALS